MISLQIADVKKFMQLLLTKETFDEFLMEEMILVKEYRMEINGAVTEGFYNDEEKEERGLTGKRFFPYSVFRPVILEQIRGKRTPELLKITLAMQDSDARKVLNSLGLNPNHSLVNEFLLQIIYDSNGLYLRTGISYKTFVPDRSMELLWEDHIRDFLKQNEIAFS